MVYKAALVYTPKSRSLVRGKKTRGIWELDIPDAAKEDHMAVNTLILGGQYL
jgi:hypothetical protein